MNPLVSLDGAVQSQGIKLSCRDWLDMGSETWSTTSDKDKAFAYQAALATGWKDEGLLKLMVGAWKPRVDEDVAKFTLQMLKDLVTEYPAQVEEVYKNTNPPPVFKVAGCDRQIPFPPKD
jgi:hypothetical protein